jgi:hypothetical protein
MMEAMEEIHTMIVETRKKRIPSVRLAHLDKVGGMGGLGVCLGDYLGF